MSVRRGSLSEALLQLDPEELQQLLDDYREAKRRDHCSRQDFASGWIAARIRSRVRQGDEDPDTARVA